MKIGIRAISLHVWYYNNKFVAIKSSTHFNIILVYRGKFHLPDY